MARPCKKRRICSKPRCKKFMPAEWKEQEIVILTLDEYECIRLIDYEGMEQEQCAVQMGVARTTIQAIYKSAREKLADAIINAKELQISGGDVVLCQIGESCSRRHCLGDLPVMIPKGGNSIMRIAVTYEAGQIYQHFGHTESFKLYDVQERKVVESKVVDTNGTGHGALATLLADSSVDVLICGGIGGGAQEALAEAGIKLYGGVSGDADAAVEAFLNEELNYNPDVKCSHHGEGHEHHGNCGSGGCGSGHCGH